MFTLFFNKFVFTNFLGLFLGCLYLLFETQFVYFVYSLTWLRQVSSSNQMSSNASISYICFSKMFVSVFRKDINLLFCIQLSRFIFEVFLLQWA